MFHIMDRKENKLPNLYILYVINKSQSVFRCKNAKNNI